MDLRKPKLHEDIHITNEVGLVNYLIGQKELEEIIQPTQVPNLDVITAGPVPPNPSELLISDQTAKLIEQLKEKYDYIVIDTPPVGLVADAMELFKYADAIIYVIRQDYTQRGMPKMIDDKYINGEVKNISYVLNDFTIKDSYGYGYMVTDTDMVMVEVMVTENMVPDIMRMKKGHGSKDYSVKTSGCFLKSNK